MKTANDVQVGDVVIFEAPNGERRRILIQLVSHEHERPTFEGLIVKDHIKVRGYCEQIAKYISHAEVNA
jgi:hypothetical protein